MTKKVAQAMIEGLRDRGVKHVFGVPSGGWVDFMEAIRNTDGIDFVLTAHEGGAGFMADVAGRLTGVPGVCFATFGPGATNLATGVGSAQLDRSPLIALTDEMSSANRDRVVQMNIDHQALMAPITKMTTRLTTDNVTETLDKAFEVATSGRPGAVHIGMPVDLTAQPATLTESACRDVEKPSVASEETLAVARTAFANARKPALVLGLGAVRAGLRDDLLRFAETHKIPVVLTPMAKGMIPETHPSYAGVVFHALSDKVGKIHAQADLMVAVGYDPVEFNYENWLHPMTLINIDDAPLDIDRSVYGDTLHVGGDILTNFRAFAQVETTDNDWDMADVRQRVDAIFAQMRPSNEEFGPCAVLDTLRAVLPDDGIMTCDVGAHTHLIGQKWETRAPMTQIMTNGWSAMGFGLPAAIAAKLCRPETPVCAVLGDGGFLMTVGELSTAVRENLNIVIVILTDNDLALIRIKQQRKGNPIFGTPVRERDGNIGGDNLFGVPVVQARDPAELRAMLEEGFGAEGPVIIEALVSSAEYDELVLFKDK
ncbi:thiamine pyrophosphate-binding protein [Sulfitobacter sp. G21635-S1]|uniref:thiamine pyrophosphate-binding protein n=1 Tax=Sulfitobacter sp. G21635-S1 TaxID=3014043 RepID=UPI0022AFDDC5|nr:thiamine pyrophosphate-binding protein [Sulfitobacter sp. G21635-S1]MCZ4256999.1 thiamine pyrophosphate-binding protein [Sulfitobacter sp. G21635-S1]